MSLSSGPGIGSDTARRFSPIHRFLCCYKLREIERSVISVSCAKPSNQVRQVRRDGRVGKENLLEIGGADAEADRDREHVDLLVGPRPEEMRTQDAVRALFHQY